MKIEIIREYILKIVLCYLIFLMSSCQPTKVKYDFIGKQDENPLIGIEGRIFGVQQTTNQLIYLIEIICDKNTLKIFSNTNYIERIGIININGVKFESEIYISLQYSIIIFRNLPKEFNPYSNSHTIELVFTKKDSTVENYKFQNVKK